MTREGKIVGDSDKVRIPLLCCKVHGKDVRRCIRAEFVDDRAYVMGSPLTKERARELGRELYEFLYANAPSDFLDGLLDGSRVTKDGL